MNFGNIVIMMSKFGSKSGDFAQRGSKSGDFAQRGTLRSGVSLAQSQETLRSGVNEKI